MSGTKNSGPARVRTLRLSAMLAVALLMMSSVLIIAIDTTDGDPEEATVNNTQTLVYHRNQFNSDAETLSIEYYGIASTEYNPEYWAGSDKVSNVSGNNWSGPYTDIDLTSAVGTVSLTATTVSADSKLNLPAGFVVLTVSGSNDVHITDSGASLTFDTVGTYSLGLTIGLHTQKVFGGWKVRTIVEESPVDKEYLPGDVVPYSSVSRDVYAIWIEPDVFVKRISDPISVTITGGDWTDGICDLSGFGDIDVKPYYEPGADSNKVINFNKDTLSNGVPKVFVGASSAYVPIYGKDADGVQRTKISMYGTIYHLVKSGTEKKNNVTMDTLKTNGNVRLPTGTYRSSDSLVTLFMSGGAQLVGDVIIDNVGLYANDSLGTHGGNANSSILACGHILIMGAGIENPSIVNAVATRGVVAPQIFGGSTSAITTALKTNKEMVFASPEHINSDDAPLTVDIATCVIIHSGIYNNVAAGGQNGAIGGTGNGPLLSTYLVLKGGWVVDTVIGGSHSNNVYAAKNGNAKITSADSTIQADEWTGGTFVYALGVNMPGDTWQDVQSGHASSDRLNFNNIESTVLEGGSHNKYVFGTTHVFVTDEANLWDVQAGGRQAASFANGTYLEVSGRSVVRHTACGTITDSGDHHAVNKAQVRVLGEAQVANVYGAGYDTWDVPNGISMKRGTINVYIDGGTVFSVFGGGYRGTIGTENSPDSLNVYVDINGGTVLGDVYGGGSGGVDKLKHTSGTNGTATNITGAGNDYTTGYSRVYGNIYVTVDGGTVLGDVYGGGMSVPKLLKYNDVAKIKDGIKDSLTGNAASVGVAAVKGTVTIDIKSGSIGGAVYGGGKGIEIDSSGNTDAVVGDYTRNCVLMYDFQSGTYSPGTIPFYTKSNGTYTYEYDASSNWINAYKEYAKIDGTVTINVSGGTVSGDVYGGGALGKVYGDIVIHIYGGRIMGTVYGGGLGTVGNLSTTGKRKVTVGGDGVISGSVYGGSALGTDGYETTSGNIMGLTDDDYDGRYDAIIYLKAGTVSGSVFGGGFKGTTYGNTHIYVGEDSLSLDADNQVYADTNSQNHVTIGESIYLGGDVGEIESSTDAYKESMVKGCGELFMADSGDVSFSGSMMGAGNSCLTAGNTSIYLKDMRNIVTESIHRATSVTLESCYIELEGRATIENVLPGVKDTDYSLYLIDDLILRNGSTVTLNGSIDYISKLRSLNAKGDETIPSAPLNKVIIGGGKVFIIRDYTKDGNVITTSYGEVEGFAIISTRGDQQSYGALVLGSPDSPGGFVVLKSGTFTKADYSDISSDCRCWYLAGAINNEVTVNVSDGGLDEVYVSMPSLQSESSYRYTGGAFLPDSPGASDYFSDDPNTPDGKFSVLFGYGTEDDCLTFNGSAGTVLHDDFGSGSPSIGEIPGETQVRNPHMNIKVTGRINENMYLGYVMIYVNEVIVVGTGVNATYVVVNSIQTKVHIYTEAVSLSSSTIDLSIVDGKGSATFIIPDGMAGYKVVVNSVTPVSNASGVPAFFMSSAKNIDNTPGWTDSLGVFTLLTDGTVTDTTIGTLQGGYSASLRIQVNTFTGSGTESYVIGMSIMNGSAVHQAITLTVVVSRTPDVSVTFKVSENIELKYSYRYGTVLTLPDCPPTEDHFVGWYTDASYNNPYSFTIPLTKDLTLYARYMFEVTLDYMDGTSSKVYVNMPSGFIGNITAPTRPGYTFGGWYTDVEHSTSWSTTTDKVTSDMTLYAFWIGWNVKVMFVWGETSINLNPDGRNTAALADCQIIEFGTKFDSSATFLVGSGETVMELLAWAQRCLEQTQGYSESGNKFIYWTYENAAPGSSSKSVAVYTETYLTDVAMLKSENGSYVKDGENYILVLAALVSKVAVNVTMDTAVIIDGQEVDNMALVDPPSSFLIFPEDLEADDPYTMLIELNGASRPGYSLKGWSIDDPLRSIAVFQDRSEPYVYPAGSVITLIISRNTDPSESSDFPWVADFKVSGSVVETMKITPAGAQRLFGEADGALLTLRFLSEWEMIPYTVTISDQAHGTIFATRIVDGTVTRFTSGTFNYGDTITLIFSPDEGYEFHKWYSSGEGLFSDASDISTTFVVHGDTSISAYMVGPQIIRVFIEYDGLLDNGVVSGEVPELYWKNGGEKVYFTKSVYTAVTDNDRTLIQYLGTATLGTHDVYLEGRSFGGEYKLGMPITSTTAQNAYYIMTSDVLLSKPNINGDKIATTGESFRVTDEINGGATVTLVSSAEVVTIGNTVTDSSSHLTYNVIGVGSNVIYNYGHAVKVLTVAGDTIYRYGYITVYSNGITDDRNGVSDLTEYIFHYDYTADITDGEVYLGTDVTIELKEGYYSYVYGGETPIESDDRPGSGIVPAAAISGNTIGGTTTQTPYVVGIYYGLALPGTITGDPDHSIRMYYGDDFLAELAGESTYEGYPVYAWYTYSSSTFTLLESTMGCTGIPGNLTVFGMYIDSTDTAVIYVRTEQVDGTYSIRNVEAPVDSTGTIHYYCALATEGFITVYNIDLASNIVDDYLVHKRYDSSSTVVNPMSESTGKGEVLVITYSRMTATFRITDAENDGTVDIIKKFGETITLVHSQDTAALHYDGWTRDGVAIDVPEEGYTVSMNDLDHTVLLVESSSAQMYTVSIITARAEIHENGVNKGRAVSVTVPYNTSLLSTDRFTLEIGGNEGDLYVLSNYSSYATNYDMKSGYWSGVPSEDSYKVVRDLTLSYVWVPKTYEVRVVIDGHTTVSGTSGTSPILFRDVGYIVKEVNTTIMETSDGIRFIADGTDATVVYVPDGVSVAIHDNIRDKDHSGGSDPVYTVESINTDVKEAAGDVSFIVTDWKNRYVTVIVGSAAIDSTITQSGPAGARTKVTPSGLDYGSIVRLSLVFEGSYTIDESGSALGGLRAVKQSSLQEYMIEFFVTGDIEIVIDTKWVGEHVTFYVILTDGSTPQIEPSLTKLIGKTEVMYLPINELEYISVLDVEGYYFDGWYRNTTFTQADLPTVAYNEHEVLCYKITGKTALYARYVKLPITDEGRYELTYDGTEQSVSVKPEIDVPLDVTVAYTQGGNPVDIPSITNCDDSNNNAVYGYTLMPRKMYTMTIDGETRYVMSDINHSYTGSFTLKMNKRILWVTADSGYWIYDGQAHSLNSYSVFGLVGGDSASVLGTVTVTGSNTDQPYAYNTVSITGTPVNYEPVLCKGTLIIVGAVSSTVSVGTVSDTLVISGEGSPIDISYSDSAITVSRGDVTVATLDGNEATIVLDGVTISSNSAHAISVGDGCNVTLVIVGECTLTGGQGKDGISVDGGATLTITGPGKLTVVGNGGSDDGTGGSAIGKKSGTPGEIRIIGLHELVARGYGAYAYGIGGDEAEVTVRDSNISAVSGGYANVTTGTYNGGPAIGGSKITIDHSVIGSAVGGCGSAAIGSRYYTNYTTSQELCIIEIGSASAITVSGGQHAASIGTGCRQTNLTGFIDGSVILNAAERSTTYTIDGDYTQAQSVGYGCLDPDNEGDGIVPYFYIGFRTIDVPEPSA